MEGLVKKYGDCGKICRIKESSWNNMWISYEGLAPNIFGAECWKYRIKTDFKDGQFCDTENVESTAWRKENYNKGSDKLILTDDFGGVEGVDTLLSLAGYCPSQAYMFHNIIKILEKIGYKVKENLFGAPYDFRKILNEEYLDLYFKMLKDLIELSSEKNKKPAIIFSHSLGGPIFSLFINHYLHKIMSSDEVQIWKKENIKSFIPTNSIGTGHSCTSNSLTALPKPPATACSSAVTTAPAWFAAFIIFQR